MFPYKNKSSHMAAQITSSLLLIKKYFGLILSDQFVTAGNSSCAKVMFPRACVKNSVHRGKCVSACTGQGCLPRKMYTPKARDRHPQTRGTPPWDHRQTPPMDTRGYGQQVGSMHPTGTQSCYRLFPL